MALYEKLTATSTPGEIAAAYKEFTGMVGGDTQSAQERAVDYLSGLGISAPTITQAYDQYRSPVESAPAYAQFVDEVPGAYAPDKVVTRGALSTAEATTPLYTGLTAQSTPEQIAAAYSQFAQGAGGDTKAAQTQAVDYLTKLGISAPTITQAYESYKSPLSSMVASTDKEKLSSDVDPYVYAYEYGVANNDFSGLRGLLQQTPDSTQLVSKYNLTPEQINQIEFGTGFDLDQSGGYGAGKVGNDWDYGKYLDELRGGNTDSALNMYKSIDPTGAKRLENMYQELRQQQTVTGDNWATGNLGSKDAAAMDFALRLMENNLDSIYDLGQRTVDSVSDWEGTPIVTQNVEYYNKKTGEALPDWGRVASGTQSGTKLDYQINFAADGTPIPYTTPAQSEWMEFREGFVKPAISIIAMANPVLMPYVAAGNALNAASKGEWGSAIVSGLTAAAGFGGDLGFTETTMAALNQAKTGAQVLNALEKGNPLAIANALMQTDTGKDLISMDMGGGVTLGDVLNTARVAAAVNEGDFASAASYAGSLLNNPDLKVAGSSLALIDAIKTGDPFKVTVAVANLDRSVKTVTKDSGGGITNRIPDDMTEAGAAAFADAKRAGASDADALEASNALTRIAEANETFDGSGLESQNAAMNAAIADGKDKFTFGGKTFTIDNSAAQIADLEKSVAADTAARAASDPEWGNLAGAVTDATARNTVTIGNAEANDLTEAAALAKVRDPSASSFTYGGKTYTMTASDSQMNDAVRADKLNLISQTPKFADAYSQARALLGPNQTFTWNGKEYSTATESERPDLTGKTTVAAATDQSAAETARLAGQNASLVTGNAPNQSAAETTRLNNLNAGLSASATKTQTDAAKAAINSVFGDGIASDLVTQGLSNIHQATGQTLAFFGGAASALGLAGPNNTLTQAGNAQTQAGEGIQLEAINTANSNVIGAVQKADGFIPKVVAGAKAIIENPLSANMAAIEILQEALPIGVAAKVYGMAGKYAAIGTDVALNAIESGGAAYNDKYEADIKAGVPKDKAESDATKSFWVASAVTAVTGGITDMALVNKITKTLDDAAAKAVTRPVSTGAVSGAKEAGSETAEVFATGVLTALALGETPDIDKILTQSIVEGYVGGKTSGSLDAGNSAIDVVSGDKNVGSTNTDLGSVGAVKPGSDASTGTDLGAIGGVAPGGDTAVSGTNTANISNNVTTQIDSGADAGVVVGDTVTGAITSGSNASTAVGSTVTSAVAAGGDASIVVGSAVTAATTAGANVDATVATSVSSAIAAGANANTVVTAAADAAIAAGNNVTVASDANTTTLTNASTNTTTTVNNNTGVTTVVDANTNTTTQTAVDTNTNTQTTVTTNANTNTNTQTTVNTNTNVTTNTTVNANTNVTTQTTTNPNTSTQTTVVTDTNTNTQTTINVNTDTGEVISEEETAIPDGWTPPKIDVPVVPSVPKPPTVTPPKAPAPAAPKLTPQLPDRAITGGGVIGLPSGINVDPASLRSKVTEGAIDPLARVKAAQAELERDVMMNQMDPRFLAAIQQRSNPQQQTKQFDDDIGALSKLLRGEPEAPANQSKYYSYGSEDSIDDILGGKAANYKEGGFVEPLKASGGMVLPLLAKSGGALGHYKGRENFKEGKHVAGEGDGQSDDIPAWLADGEFVFPADVVSALGNGSTKAGTDKLYEMMHGIRDRARSKGPKDLPPPALKSPLNYLKSSKRSTS